MKLLLLLLIIINSSSERQYYYYYYYSKNNKIEFIICKKSIMMYVKNESQLQMQILHNKLTYLIVLIIEFVMAELVPKNTFSRKI